MSHEIEAKIRRETVEMYFNNMCGKIDDELFGKCSYERWNEFLKSDHTKCKALSDIVDREVELRKAVFSELDAIIEQIIKLEQELTELKDTISNYPPEIRSRARQNLYRKMENLCGQIMILDEYDGTSKNE